MDRSLLLFALLLVGISDAALPSERYWHKVMPNTPMPDVIRAFLYADFDDEKATAVDVGKGGVHVDAGKGKPDGGTSVDVGGKGGVDVHTKKGTSVQVGPGGKPGVIVNTPTYKGKGKPVIVNVGPQPFIYRYAATEDQIHDNPSVAYFFLEKDLQTNQKMNLHFVRTTPGATFLPRSRAEAIPFSSAKFPEILRHFSVEPESEESMSMKQTLQECEEPAINGEDKYCATSLESMVDFTTSKLGTDVQVLATTVNKESAKQRYTIVAAPHKVMAPKSVACHSESYAYAVFYCHETRATKAYMASLVGEDGSKVEAVVVCHEDTSAWNPKHLAFQLLKVKPGSVPVCHFLPQDHIVWVPVSTS